MECPFCHAHVEPERNEAGRLVCPLCANHGVAREPSRESLAKASLVVGIIGVALPVAGFILGVVAVALSHRSEQRFLQDASLSGRSKATAGMVLGLVAVCLHGMLFMGSLAGRS